MKYIIVILVYMFSSNSINADELEKLLSKSEIYELQNIIASTSLSCASKILDPKDLARVTQELKELGKGIASVLAEKLLTLSFKKDYPNACHVLTEDFLKELDEGSVESRVCLNRVSGHCIHHESRKTPIYAYHWPKYFIEVSVKGNDPHPSFAYGNRFYSANRIFADKLSGFLDLEGPYKLAAKVTLGAPLLKAGTSALFGQGVDFSPTGSELSQAASTTILTPFQKMRIRAAQDSELPSYEVNIWPVGLSQSIAKHLTLCKKGGFEWPISGVPMTCPVAMSRDSWSYWDSGMLDYMNPNAIRGMASATNPASCIADNAAAIAFDQHSAKDQSAPASAGPEVDNKKKELLTSLPKSFRGVGMCSLPILGDAEAITTQFLNTVDSFKGPWCTIWGAVAPRASTQVYASDYAFANAALRFKTLSHDIFGLPRGKKERWALAYPWEGVIPTFSDGNEGFDYFDFLIELNKKFNILPSIDNTLTTSRSNMLMFPGDPRLIDIAYDPKTLLTDVKNLTRELAYIMALERAASEGKKLSNNFLNHSENEHQEQFQVEVKGLSVELGNFGKEPILEKRIYCHVDKEDDGQVKGSRDFLFEIPGHGLLEFERIASVEECQKKVEGRCLKRHRVTRKCDSHQNIHYISIEKFDFVGEKEVERPKRYAVSPIKCSVKKYQTTETNEISYYCNEEIKELAGERDPFLTDLPDENIPSKESKGSNSTAKVISEAARISTIVGTEIYRARYEEILGKSLLPGKKRVYTIFEEISCQPEDEAGVPIYQKKVGPVWAWEQCNAAIRYEVTKYFQKRLLRKVCDTALASPIGGPFR